MFWAIHISELACEARSASSLRSSFACRFRACFIRMRLFCRSLVSTSRRALAAKEKRGEREVLNQSWRGEGSNYAAERNPKKNGHSGALAFGYFLWCQSVALCGHRRP